VIGDDTAAALADTVSGWAFGPVFASRDEATLFVRWLRVVWSSDARANDDLLAGHYATWLEARDAHVLCIECGRRYTLGDVLKNGDGGVLENLRVCSRACEIDQKERRP
jgi:hypothetical protein